MRLHRINNYGFTGLFTYVLSIVAGICMLSSVSPAGDWPQWRGPNRDGVASKSPALISQFGSNLPVKVWESEPIAGGSGGGYGQVSIAGDLVCLAVHAYKDVPIQNRVLKNELLTQLGWAAAMPEDLVKTAEDARVSEVRAKLKDNKEINPWADQWLKENLKPEWGKFKPAVRARLVLGSQALPMPALAKLAPIAEKEYASPEDFASALKECGLDEAGVKLVADKVAKTKRVTTDSVYALDRASGKTLWKSDFPGNFMYFPNSTAPCLVNGRCYFMASTAVMHCLDLKDGRKVWESKPLGAAAHSHNRSSSVLVFGDKAIAGTETAYHALDIKTGEIIWTTKEAVHKEASAVACRIDGKDVIICAGGSAKVVCLDPATGKALWNVPGGSAASTPAIKDDCMVFAGGTEAVGLAAYKLSLAEPKKLWNVPFKDQYASPVIYKKHVYAVGGGNGNAGKGRALCIELQSGKVMWDEPLNAELASPVLADGKLIATAGAALVMINANPDKYELLGTANLGLSAWISPAFADGKLFLRTGNKVVCYDLTGK